MKTARHEGIRVQLLRVESELRRLDVWESFPPAPERLASVVPFCHDTLAFTQWVQWVFLPRFHAVIEGNHPLPSASAIVPVAEIGVEGLRGDADALLDAFREIDALINNA
jgi:uncharacterized protein YqcC (DUF446 family)